VKLEPRPNKLSQYVDIRDIVWQTYPILRVPHSGWGQRL
jgi:hypothetical protein